MKVRAAVMPSPGTMEVRSFPFPRLSKDIMTVKMEMSAICGTDGHLYAGEIPDIRYPVIPGHENIGTVEEFGPGMTEMKDAQGRPLSEGDRVVWSNCIPCGKCYGCRWLAWPKSSYCVSRETYGFDNCEDPSLKPWLYGGWAEYICIKPGSWVYKVPDELPSDVAVLIDTLVSVRGVETNMSVVPVMKEGFAPLDTIVVQGAGPVGVMAAFKAKVLGADKVIMIGGPAKRLKLATEFGVDGTINIDEISKPADRVDEVMKMTDGVGADMVVECTGFPSALPEGIDMCRTGGTYVLIGCWADRGNVGINPSKIVTRELRLVGQKYASPQQYGRDLRTLHKFAKTYPFKKLITHRFSIDSAKEAFELQRDFRSMKTVITSS